VCNPGFSDPACLIECGDPGTAYAFREIEDTTFGMTIGQISAGEVSLFLVIFGYFLLFSYGQLY
jgi:hypothetical protein